ncbi:uncharacterized protein [Acropora muricata]|uniref:uncharacterized protein isoform X2 n=1 Tax=Acropora muricata TaxID=159855 RepID=UPI0034E47BFF
MTSCLRSGEGESYCFISNPEAVLYFFVAPIALIMLFNAFALVRTVLHIVKTRKRRQKVTNQRHSTGVSHGSDMDFWNRC